MALINCPECDAEVSDKARQCPKCAYPLIDEVEEVKLDKGSKQAGEEGCFLKSLNIGCLIISAIVVAVILAFLVSATFGL